jgi:hypothetical protein
VAEELIFQVGYVAIALVGLWQFHCAAAKWAVLLNAPTWPTATAKLRSARVDYTESRRLANPSDITDPSYYHSVDIGPFFSTVTDRYYVPNLRFTYDHGGETITTDNLAPHNRHAVYFNRDDVAAIVKKYESLRTFPIRYHPNRPGHVFLGPRHFPYVATLLQTVGGLFFTLAFTITVEFILTQMGLEEPSLAGRPISLYIVTGLALGYGLVRILRDRVA